ncbi:hypothetical protein VTK73DRAFT_7741 [Phialemonium thermophilum]|uniref:Major facilitator superfamily (MFS) profile domain-containing protein n=1 Tax=Phialemonium thermophilum TaxID=223376 RepID=A0ABR3WD42_9PEZI
MTGYTRYFNRSLTGAVLLVATSTFNFGFDNQGFATTQAMDAFTRRFGVEGKDGKWALDSVWLSLFSSVIYVGFGFGILFGSWLSGRFGRKKTLFVLNAYEIVTATIIVTSRSKEQLLAGRVLNYGYVGMELAVIPVFQSEIVPRQVRGFVVSTYQFALIFGGLVMNCVCLGTSGLQDDRAYRIPYGLFYIIPTVVMIGSVFVPESPRWLMIQDRHDEALANLRQLRAGVFTEDEILREFETLRIGLAEEQDKGRFLELFQGRNLLRTFIACGIHGFQNTCGQDLVSKFGSLIVKSLQTISPFIMTVVFAVTNLVFVFGGMMLSDKVGRRPLLLLSAFLQMAGCLVLGGIGTTGWPLPKHVQPVSIVMLVVVTAGFSIGFAPLSNVVTTEVTPLRLRDKTQGVSCLMNVFGSFAVGFSAPYLLNPPYAALHMQIGWVFAPVGFCALLFVFFFVPECRGKSMEEVDWLFHNRVPIRQFESTEVPDLVDAHTAKVLDEDGKEPAVHVEAA